jgi:hypothetical protein
MSAKQRLSASVDAAVLAAAQTAVSEGRAVNVSAWVNEALHRQAAHDGRMRALDAFVEHYEAVRGVITDDEIRAATRRTRARAVVVRGRKAPKPSHKKRRRGSKAA